MQQNAKGRGHTVFTTVSVRAFPLVSALTLSASLAAAQSMSDAASLEASAPDMLLRGAAANCLSSPDDIGLAVAAFQSAGWQGDAPDDGGLWTLSLDEVTASVNIEARYCAVESSVLGFAEGIAVASDLVTLEAGGKAEITRDTDGCLYVYSDADPGNYIAITTGGNDPMCQEQPDGGVALTVLDEG